MRLILAYNQNRAGANTLRRPKAQPRPVLGLLSGLFQSAVAVALLAVALARQGGFETLLLAGLQIESVPLDFLNDVLLQDLTFETAERILQRFTILNVNFSQRTTSCYTGQQPNGMLP